MIVQDNKSVEVNAEIHTTVDLDGKTVGKQITPYVNRKSWRRTDKSRKEKLIMFDVKIGDYSMYEDFGLQALSIDPGSAEVDEKFKEIPGVTET